MEAYAKMPQTPKTGIFSRHSVHSKIREKGTKKLSNCLVFRDKSRV